MILRIVVFLGIILFVEGQAPTVQISLGGTGSTASQGRVEITRNGIRGTVCNDRFTDLAAAVVCRQLNYANGGTAVTDGRFGPGTGPIWLDDVECQGNELHIEQCISRPWNESNCGHDEDVGVVCNVSPIASSSVSPATTRAPATVQPSNCTVPSPNIRLVGPSNLRGIGFVEVRRNGVWGSICDDQWGRDDAKVVCRMLCYDPNIAQAGAPVDINHVSDQVSNNYLLDNVECVGTETDIEQCPRANQIDCDATVHEYASVTCVRLLNNQPQAPVPELECTSGRFYARFSRTQDPNLEAKHLSIFYPFNGPCNIEKPTTPDTVSIVIPYGQCGTVTTYNATHIFYTNSIKYDYTVIENQIVRVNTYRIEASCEFPRDYDSNEGYTPLTETVTQKAPGRFIIDMTFFNDSFVTPLNGSIQLTLGEWLNVALTLEAVDPNLKLIVPNCKATPTSAPNDPTFFDLFHNKCANDPTLGFFPLNSTVFGFRYQTFKFVSFSNVIIQCDAFVCLVSEKNAECDRTCNTTSTSGTGRRKRDTSGRDIYRVVSQPMKFQQHGDGVVIDRGDGWEVNLVTTRAATTATTLNAMPTTNSQSTTSKGSSVPSTTPKATTKVTEVKTSTTVQSATSLSSSTVPTTTPQQTSTTLQTTTAQPMTMSSTIPTTGKISLTSAQTTLSPTTTTATNRHPSSTSTSSLKSSSTDNKQAIGTTLAAKVEPTSSTEKQHVPKPKELYVGGLGGLSILSGSGTLHYYLFINILSLLFLYIIHSVI